MANNSKEKKKGLKAEVTGIALLSIALFAAVSLLSYSSEDIAANWGGIVGGYSAWLLITVIGYSAYLFPVLILLLALEFLIRREFKFRLSIPISLLFLLLAFSGLVSSLIGNDTLSGGFVGKYVCLFLWNFFSYTGTLIILSALFIISSVLATGISVVAMISKGYGLYQDFTQRESDVEDEEEEEELEEEEDDEEDEEEERPARKKVNRPEIIMPAPPKKQPKPKESTQEHFEFLKPSGTYQLPSISFLDPPPEKAQAVDEEALTTNSKILEKKLKDYGIDGQVIAVTPGPIVTMYEFEPAPGVKVASIMNLSDDLALALRAVSIRIIAPIPGKAVVGIEVPNVTRQKIYLREILESTAYAKSNSKLAFGLGKDISGNAVITDLAKMPHILMAGATGAGKSVTLNSVIIGILYKATPVDVRFLMIDPKMLELSAYEGIPHLLTPVVTDPKRASVVLRGMVNEMGERYKLMAEKGAKNIEKYNQLVEEGKDVNNENNGNHQRLPYIVVVIDELSDLMMVAGKDVEDSLVRLSQMARAAGIHLLVATQRPSVDVITGLIKANFPARISLQVASRTDSRTILDGGGAETLLGEGDMLFLPPGTARVKRIHGAYVSEGEIKKVTDFLKKQGKPTYDVAIAEAKAEEKGFEDEELDEEFNKRYDEAVQIVMRLEQASTSYVQRRLRIGYNTAARIIEKMEAEGIVGPAQGSRPREVLMRRNGDGE